MNEISLCMIVKNEEAKLELCLSSVAGYVDEIIIVDTGSTDKTKEIALSFTDLVYDYVWTNDFSAARNYAISKASYDYILIIDSDEIINKIDIDQIKELMYKYPTKIGRLMCTNEYTRNGMLYKYSERISRFFSKKYYRYEGIIHEQIVPIKTADIKEVASTLTQTEKYLMTDDNTQMSNTYLLPLTVRHSGYEGDLDTRKKKTERNISLLKLAQAKNPEDPYILYQLGKSYYMQGDYLSACDYLGQALYFDLDPRLEYVQDMVESYGYSLINSEQYETAMQLLNIYDEFAHSADFIFLIALILMNNNKFHQAIEEFIKATSMSSAKMEGVNSYLANYNIAVIYECLGENELAVEYYSRCEDYEAARQRLIKII